VPRTVEVPEGEVNCAYISYRLANAPGNRPNRRPLAEISARKASIAGPIKHLHFCREPNVRSGDDPLAGHFAAQHSLRPNATYFDYSLKVAAEE
jgi:hypothetical protein